MKCNVVYEKSILSWHLLIFLNSFFQQDAKKDENIRQAYKFLVALHDNCAYLLDTVNETGAILREIRELEDQVTNH